jgi:type VI secretion system secreted protein VgrG
MHTSWLDIPAFPAHTFRVYSFSSEQLALNSNYRFSIRVQTLTRVTPNLLLMKPVKLILDNTTIPSVIHGVLSSIKQLVSANNYFNYEISLEAPTIALTTIRRSRVFLQQTIKEIANIVLAPFGKITWQLTKNYQSRDLVVQYNETDWDFLLRILSSAGISFSFLQNDELELVLFDSLNSLPSVGSIPYAARAKMTREQNTVWEAYYQLKLTANGTEKTNFAKTDNMQLHPGMLLTITDHPDSEFNQSYRVIGQQSSGRSDSPGADEGIEEDIPQFMNELTLIPADVAYKPALIKHKPFYGTLMAKTESVTSDVQAHLNEAGHYRVRLSFDEGDTEAAQASPPLMLVQAHGGANSGFHHPLLPGTAVMISALDGNIETPVILGAWPSESHQPPVTSANANDHIMRSTQGHTMQLTDHSDAPFVKMQSADNINQLHLQSDLNNPFVALTTLGALSLNAKKTLTCQTEQNANHSVGGSATITAAQNQQTVVAGESKYHSGSNIITQAKQNLTRQTTEKNIVQQAQKDIALQAKNDQGYLSESGHIGINSAKAVTLISAKDLNLGTDKDLFIESKDASLAFTASGDHLIKAKKITLSAPMININGTMVGLNPMGLSGSGLSTSQYGNNAVPIPMGSADMYVDHDVQSASTNSDTK